MRRKIAIPWLADLDVLCKREEDPYSFDMEVEKIDTGKLPPKYERALKKFFHTDDKARILQKAWKGNKVPVFCPACNSVELVDKDKGKSVRKIGRRMRGKAGNVLFDILRSPMIDEPTKKYMSDRVRRFDKTRRQRDDLSPGHQKLLYKKKKYRKPLTKDVDVEIIESPHAVYRRKLRDIDINRMVNQITEELACNLDPQAPACPVRRRKRKPKLKDFDEHIKGPAGTAVVEYDLTENPADAFIITQWK